MRTPRIGGFGHKASVRSPDGYPGIACTRHRSPLASASRRLRNASRPACRGPPDVMLRAMASGRTCRTRSGRQRRRESARRRMQARSSGLPPTGRFNHPVPVLRPRDIGTVRTDAVKRAAGLDLGRQVRLDLLAPVFRESRYVGWRRVRFPVFAHTADLACNRRAVQSASTAVRTATPLSRCPPHPAAASAPRPAPPVRRPGRASRRQCGHGGLSWWPSDGRADDLRHAGSPFMAACEACVWRRSCSPAAATSRPYRAPSPVSIVSAAAASRTPTGRRNLWRSPRNRPNRRDKTREREAD